MMRLDEAQQLLFMRGKVNNILVSNQGDELAGIEHTEAVSDRLRVLALDERRGGEVPRSCAVPDVRASSTPKRRRSRETVAEEFDVPRLSLRRLLEDLTNIGRVQCSWSRRCRRHWIGRAQRSAAPGADQQPGARVAARARPAPHETARNCALRIRSLNQFDLIDPLSKSTVVTVADVGGTIFTLDLLALWLLLRFWPASCSSF